MSILEKAVEIVAMGKPHKIPDTGLVCGECRGRAEHLPRCPRFYEPWPTLMHTPYQSPADQFHMQLASALLQAHELLKECKAAIEKAAMDTLWDSKEMHAETICDKIERTLARHTEETADKKDDA